MIKVKSPINIALIKYWGKQDTLDIKPSTPSISLTLKAFYTVTTVEKKEALLSFTLDEVPQTNLEKIKAFISQFTTEDTFKITSHNTGPTAAGLASSASGFSALGFAMNHFYPQNEMKFRQFVANGSGSAIRSLLGGAVKWDTDGAITQIPFKHEEYLMAMILINTNKKEISSRVAMKASSQLDIFKGFVKRNKIRAHLMEKAMKDNDFHFMGTLMEESTLDMHALTLFHQTPFSFLTSESITIIHKIIALRKKGLYGYFTADAGPNIKVLFKKKDKASFDPFLKALNYPVVISEIDDQGARYED